MKRIHKLAGTIADTVRRYPLRSSFLLLCVIVITGFERWNPNAPLLGHGWNRINMESITVDDPDHFSFAVFGDNRNSKYIFENLLKLIDHDQRIDFAMSLGNMVSRGKPEKYQYVMEQIKHNLGIPLLTVIGKRELKGSGRRLYMDIFGTTHYSFHIGTNYFMALDDVDKEGLDLMKKEGWLTNELQRSQAYNSRFVFMHMPLYDPRGGRYQKCLAKDSAKKLQQFFSEYHVTRVFTAGIHGYFDGRWNGIPYTITGGAGAKPEGDDPAHYFYHYLKVNIHDAGVDVQGKRVPYPDYIWMDRLIYNCEQALLFFKVHFLTIIMLAVGVCLGLSVYRSESRQRKFETDSGIGINRDIFNV